LEKRTCCSYQCCLQLLLLLYFLRTLFSSKLITMATEIHHARLYLIPFSKRWIARSDSMVNTDKSIGLKFSFLLLRTCNAMHVDRMFYHQLKKSIYIEVSLTTVSFQIAGSNGSASESSASCKGVYPIEGGPPSLLLFCPMVSWFLNYSVKFEGVEIIYKQIPESSDNTQSLLSLKACISPKYTQFP
jgi:hypothetical protein